jgi:chromosome partitioning protein
MITLAFFNNKGGVGKTALVSHLAWMFASRGVCTLAADLDPQSNLSSMFVDEARLETLWKNNQTVASSVEPLLDRRGDIAPTHLEPVAPNLHLLVGHLGLSRFEDLLAENWAKCLTGEVGAFRVMSAFHRVMAGAAQRVGAQIVLIDLGPNLGPLNRAALLAADHLVVPVAPDLFSLQGMENLGPTLRSWRKGWAKRVEELEELEEGALLPLPRGEISPIGYVVMSFGVRDSRPVAAYDHWLAKVPGAFRAAVLGRPDASAPPPQDDPFCLAALKHYRSLMPMAMAAHQPMFQLRAAEGARGAHLDAVRLCHEDFLKLARRIGDRLGVAVP